MKGIIQFVALICIAVMFQNKVLAAEINIDDMAGAYRTHFENEDEGKKYWSENLLELVKVSPSAAYFRTSLSYANGHSCNLWGVAKLEENELVYRTLNDLDEPCVFKIANTGKSLKLSDEKGEDGGRCAATSCGARGSYNDIEFPLEKKRPIKYIDKIIKSPEYSESLKKYKEK